MKEIIESLKKDKFPYDVQYIINPSQKELRKLALKYTPAILKTAYGNLNKITRLKARMAKYTYIIAPESEAGNYSSKVISPEKAKKLIDIQKKYIEKVGKLIVIEGYLGLGEKAVGVRWFYTPEASNVAGMQQVLVFPPNIFPHPFKAKFNLIYTPNLLLEDMPGKMAILVDLENYITYVIGSDYFGESKKGALRMLNDWVYLQGGLVFHAGAKVVHLKNKKVLMGIMGLSGTGKTTTTFSKQGELTQPVQDDMIALWAVELLRDEVRRMGKDIPAFEIDCILWHMGQEDTYRKKPYHMTPTIFY